MAELSKLGRYELRRVLGKGAMGVVYEGFDPTLHRRVAVKTILKSVAIDAETSAAYSKRFVTEAQAVARLNHPHIVQVHDFGEENEVAYLVMEFIEGRELRAFFDANEKFETAEVVRIMSELLGALDFAHERGVIHRDVKPANVMLDAQKGVKLADFGVARVQDSDRSAAGTMVGTPAFMSPEQIKGAKIDRRTDIFSAGVVLYQLLTGEQPFKGEGAWTVAKKIVEDDPPLPSTLVRSLPAAFDAVVNKALAKLPPQRFANAKEFAAALRNLKLDAPVPAASAPAAPSRAETKASETELEFWRSIQNRDDLEELELYLEQFPNGAYTQLARLKVAKLRAPHEAARKEAEEKARAAAEAKEKARKEAEERARREAAEKARREAETRAMRDAEEKAKREAAEKAKKAAEEKARREAEEKKRQAEALARLKAQEAARAKADKDATVSMRAPATEAPKKSAKVPIAIGLAMVAAGGIAYLAAKRPPEPAPAQVAEKSPPLKAERPKIDVDKIRREAEERVRREYAEKSAAEQAALAKAAAEKAMAEKQAAAKAAAEKATAEKLAAEKAAAEKARIAASDKAATDKAAAAKAAAEKLAAERVAAEKAAAEKIAAEKLAAEKAAAQRSTAEQQASASVDGLLERFRQRKGAASIVSTEPSFPDSSRFDPVPLGTILYVNDGSCPRGQIKQVKGGNVVRNIDREYSCVSLGDDRVTGDKPRAREPAAALKPSVTAPTKPGWPSVGDRWVYEARDIDRPERSFQIAVDVQSVAANAIRDVSRPAAGPSAILTHGVANRLVAIAPGIVSFSPYLSALHPLRGGERWQDLDVKQISQCVNVDCKATAHVIGKERVAVKAGNYDAWKIVVDLRTTAAYSGTGFSSGHGAELTYWHVESVNRIVKYRAIFRGGMQPNMEMELVSYNPASGK